MFNEMPKTDKLPYEPPKVRQLSKLENIAMEARIKREAQERLKQKGMSVKVSGNVIKRRKAVNPLEVEVTTAVTSAIDKLALEVAAKKPSGLTGREFEIAMASSVDIKNKKYQSDYQQILEEQLKRQGHTNEQIKKEIQGFADVMLWDIGEQAAILLLKKNQPADPVNPTAPFGKAIRQALITELGVTDPKKQAQVKFYTAVSRNKITPKEAGNNMEEMLKTMTVLDAYYKTDCFIEIGGDKEGESVHSIGYTIPFDLTVNREKRNPKAFIVEDIALPDEREKQEMFDKYARLLAIKAIREMPDSTKKFLNAVPRQI